MSFIPEKDNIFDLIIIGSGPAGLTASIYASRYGIKHLIIGDSIGGLASGARIKFVIFLLIKK